MSSQISSRIKARSDLRYWISEERTKYADRKYETRGKNRDALIKAMKTEGMNGIWLVHIQNYIGRANTLGLETLQGRQAMGKAIVTMMHCLETAIEEYGPMPLPGVPSGEISNG